MSKTGCMFRFLRLLWCGWQTNKPLEKCGKFHTIATQLMNHAVFVAESLVLVAESWRIFVELRFQLH